MFTFSIGYNLQIDWSKFYERISLLLMDPVYFVKHDAFGFKSITGTDMFESIHNFRFATGIFLMSKLICWKSENNLWKDTFLWVQIHPTLILVLWLLVYNVSIKQVVIDLTKIWRKHFSFFNRVIYLPIYRRISRRVHSSAWNHGPLFLIRLPYSQLTPLCLWAPRTWTRTHWAFWPTGRRRKTCP